MSTRTSEELRAQCIQAMGSELGELYYAFYEEALLLHTWWAQFQKLYAHSPERVELLNEAAGYFFSIVQVLLWESALLHLARLTDRPKTQGWDNLAIQRLADAVQARSPGTLLAHDVQGLVNSFKEKCRFAREWRNLYLAHRDLDVALHRDTARLLPPADRMQVEDALACLKDILNRLSVHYQGIESHFLLDVGLGGADTLVYHLKRALGCKER